MKEPSTKINQKRQQRQNRLSKLESDAVFILSLLIYDSLPTAGQTAGTLAASALPRLPVPR